MERKNLENLFLSFLGNKVHGTQNHDGVVHADSCKAVNPEAPWSSNSNSDYWLAQHNHNGNFKNFFFYSNYSVFDLELQNVKLVLIYSFFL